MSTSAAPATFTVHPASVSQRYANKDHHVGSPRSHFRNPWPSAGTKTGLGQVLSLKFGSHPEKKFIPVPQGPNGTRSKELVQVVEPDWSQRNQDKLRATWLGHAGWMVELPTGESAERGVRILFDPVFSERTSPSQWFGPKRYSPTPCTIHELPVPDIICISHNHYDHLDFFTVSELVKRSGDRIHFFTPLGTKPWFEQHVKVRADQVTESDWWDSHAVSIPKLGSVKITCAPAQHTSGRTAFDANKTLWCSYAVQGGGKNLFFAGDTAYQAQNTPSPCPIFEQVGETLGPFDLALLPIGLMTPASFMGAVHATPEQSLQIHTKVKSRLSIGMHYGTVRGGLSGQFEPVTEPPRRWRVAAEKAGLWRGGGVEGDGRPVTVEGSGVGLCDIGETVAV